MPTIKPKIKSLGKKAIGKIRTVKRNLSPSNIKQKVINFFNKKTLDKYIDIKNPEKLDILFGVVCADIIAITKPGQPAYIKARKKVLAQVIKDLYEVKFRFGAIKRDRYGRYNKETINDEIETYKDRAIFQLLTIWERKRSAKEFEEIYNNIKRKENIEEIASTYYMYH